MLKETSQEAPSFFRQNQSDIEHAVFTGLITTGCATMAVLFSDKVAGVGALLFGGATAAYVGGIYKALKNTPR